MKWTVVKFHIVFFIQIKQTVELRTRINQRERRRMHDLNVAMDALREVMPYGNGPSVRRLSKIATLSLARNYIQMLTKSVEELKHMLDEAYRARGVQGHYPRGAPLVYPETWNFTSRGPRGVVPFNGYPSSALHSGCFDTTCTNEGSYSCCSAISGSSLSIRGSHPRLHALQRQWSSDFQYPDNLFRFSISRQTVLIFNIQTNCVYREYLQVRSLNGGTNENISDVWSLNEGRR